jgi:hypothetical protein
VGEVSKEQRDRFDTATACTLGRGYGVEFGSFTMPEGGSGTTTIGTKLFEVLSIVANATPERTSTRPTLKFIVPNVEISNQRDYPGRFRVTLVTPVLSGSSYINGTFDGQAKVYWAAYGRL